MNRISKKISLILTILFLIHFYLYPSDLKVAESLINGGKWSEAKIVIDNLLKEKLTYHKKKKLLFLKERMKRIRLDFNKTREEVLDDAKKIYPDITETEFKKWDDMGDIEKKQIEGKILYFSEAGRNLFRVNNEAKAIKKKIHPSKNRIWNALGRNIKEIINNYKNGKGSYNSKKKLHITFTVSIPPDTIPHGEILKVWLPFPKALDRQSNITLSQSFPKKRLISSENSLQRTIYFENIAIKGKPSKFKIKFKYDSTGFYKKIDPSKVTKPDLTDKEIKKHTGERLPHIYFSEKIKEISKQITGNEKNPYLIAKKIFIWVTENIPWASAREYSTIDSISAYALKNRWGDCGIQTLLFMTLCRLNGIPAKWESGATAGSNYNIHDWCRIYIAPYGWIPVDPSYGQMPSGDPDIRFFYFGNIDSYRIVYNSDYSREFYPLKTFFRSDTIDSQRGEAEWRGGNIYFNNRKWDLIPEEIK